MIHEKFSPESKQIPALAKQESENEQHFYVGVAHLFVYLTKVVNGLTHAIRQQLSLNPK